MERHALHDQIADLREQYDAVTALTVDPPTTLHLERDEFPIRPHQTEPRR